MYFDSHLLRFSCYLLLTDPLKLVVKIFNVCSSTNMWSTFLESSILSHKILTSFKKNKFQKNVLFSIRGSFPPLAGRPGDTGPFVAARVSGRTCNCQWAWDIEWAHSL